MKLAAAYLLLLQVPALSLPPSSQSSPVRIISPPDGTKWLSSLGPIHFQFELTSSAPSDIAAAGLQLCFTVNSLPRPYPRCAPRTSTPATLT